MQTFVELTDEQVAQLKEFTEQEDLSAATRIAVEEYIRYVLRKRLIELSGQFEMQESWREMDEAELAENHGHGATGSD